MSHRLQWGSVSFGRLCFSQLGQESLGYWSVDLFRADVLLVTDNLGCQFSSSRQNFGKEKKKSKLSYVFFFLFYRLIMLVSHRWKWLTRATSGNLADWKRTAALQGSCKVWSMEESKNEKVNQAHVLFDRFVQASTCKGTLKAFQELCDYLELKPKDYRSFYHKLKSKLNYWKAKALWAKLDKRGSHKDYKKGKACANTKVRDLFTVVKTAVTQFVSGMHNRNVWV